MKLKSLLIALLLNGALFAQAPQLMTYQSVLRNGTNQLLTNAPVGMRLSIVQGSTSGTTVYVETHQAFTNTNGLVSVLIGAGNPVTGTIAAIDWANGPYYIKTEVDMAGGTDYLMFGIQQLVSVPYALYAETAGTVINGGGSNTPGPQGPAGPAGPAGADGLSAYDLAVNNGFTGSLQDWLNSLVGPEGPQGIPGQGQGVPGPAGADGLSAYELAVGNGFNGTLQDWLASLQGPAGATGATGPAGPQGPAGSVENIVLNQSGTTVYSTNFLNSPTSFTLIPGLTQTITVPANSLVFITTNGGIQNATTSVNVAATDIAVYVDNAINANFQQRVAIPNAIAGNNFINNWTISGIVPLAAGTHTIEVRAQNVSQSAATQIAGTNALVKGQLTVLILKQ